MKTPVPACHDTGNSFDWLLWISFSAVVFLYLLYWQFTDSATAINWLHMFSHSVFELVNTVWWGVAIGIFMIGILGRIPREFVMSALGTKDGARGIWRASLAGILLDLCSHGILMVGAKLYERGASAGQVMAFLVSSPWNSFSLTLILIALIGAPWTFAFIIFSMLIAFITGLLFDYFVRKKVLPGNPQQVDLPDDFQFWHSAKQGIADTEFSTIYFGKILIDGIKDSRMVVRWILFGILLASGIRAFLAPELFAEYFGPTFIGLGMTILVATVLEVCSEGSTPIAADLLTRANAPGNSFAFLMGGVATDYTEIVVLKDATKSWKIALFLPLITLPQVIFLGWIMNSVTI
ncbi:MAG: permease [Pseudomonadales bacterium]|nr:permease [Pseudomonadales bacterium]